MRLSRNCEFRLGHLDPAGGGDPLDRASSICASPYGDAIDKPAEIARLKKEIERLAKDIESKQKRLADETFRSKAPAEIVRNMEATLAERQIELQKLLDRLKQLE